MHHTGPAGRRASRLSTPYLRRFRLPRDERRRSEAAIPETRAARFSEISVLSSASVCKNGRLSLFFFSLRRERFDAFIYRFHFRLYLRIYIFLDTFGIYFSWTLALRFFFPRRATYFFWSFAPTFSLREFMRTFRNIHNSSLTFTDTVVSPRSYFSLPTLSTVKYVID